MIFLSFGCVYKDTINLAYLQKIYTDISAISVTFHNSGVFVFAIGDWSDEVIGDWTDWWWSPPPPAIMGRSRTWLAHDLPQEVCRLRFLQPANVEHLNICTFAHLIWSCSCAARTTHIIRTVWCASHARICRKQKKEEWILDLLERRVVYIFIIVQSRPHCCYCCCCCCFWFCCYSFFCCYLTNSNLLHPWTANINSQS